MISIYCMYQYHVKWVPCHMAHPQAVDGDGN